MKKMKTIKFPNTKEAYDIYDDEAVRSINGNKPDENGDVADVALKSDIERLTEEIANMGAGGGGGGSLILDVDGDSDTVITPLSDIVDAVNSGRMVCMKRTLSPGYHIFPTLKALEVRSDTGALYLAELSVITHNGASTAMLHQYTIFEDSTIEYAAYEIAAEMGR